MLPREVVSLELARHLAGISAELGRQVGVLLTREGAVRNVIVGDAHRIEVPDVGRLRGGVGRFRGLRLVHTHLRGEGLTRDDLTDLALLRLDLVAMIEVDDEGQPGRVEIAYLAPAEGDDGEADTPYEDNFHRVEAPRVHRLELDFEATMAALEEEFARVTDAAGETGRERALVIAITPDDEHFAETLELVRSAGVDIAGTVRQKRFQVHPKTVVGQGKLQEIVLEGMRRRAEVAIFDIDLKPAQARAFEDATGLKAVDRTQLILDIFAQRAKSRDGKLQVELAQLKYRMPRLAQRADVSLSRLAGGIGGRGPGETKLEVDRRRVRDRIARLERELQKLRRERSGRRQRRQRQGLPVLSIVGYTNAGKSTLLRALTKTEAHVEDRLFATLDPASRRLRFPQDRDVIVTDTVGFIRDLPPDLAEAFRATLEELSEADLFLHVVDAAAPDPERRMAAVWAVLEEMGLRDTPELLVLNQVDRLPPGLGEALAERHGGVPVSALTREGLDVLLDRAAAMLWREERTEHGRRRMAAISAGGETG